MSVAPFNRELRSVNVLPMEKQVAVVGALCEGMSIRSVERLTGIHRDTIMRLGARVGAGCAEIHDLMFRDLRIRQIQIDELWAFIGKKQRKLTPLMKAPLMSCRRRASSTMQTSLIREASELWAST